MSSNRTFIADLARAAVWAADEAAARNTLLDLIYVVDPARDQYLDDAMAVARQGLHLLGHGMTSLTS